jgi:hypothetical protein
MQLTQNRKTIAGASIILTAGAFMLAEYGSVFHVPLPVLVVHLLALSTGGGLMCWGTSEEHKLKNSLGTIDGSVPRQ